jgi:hypothetical protein
MKPPTSSGRLQVSFASKGMLVGQRAKPAKVNKINKKKNNELNDKLNKSAKSIKHDRL